MKRVDSILENRKYQEYIAKNNAAEEQRIFCRHNMSHFLDVARIAALLNEEEAMEIPKEYIYAAALLHDIGRHVQYEDGTPHELAGAALAQDILEDTGFDKTEQALILEAIRDHRNQNAACERNLCGILYRADKLSRPCFACDAAEQCNWDEGKKNLKLRY